LVELIDIIAAFEEWTASEKFCQDAANGPDIDYNPPSVHVIENLTTFSSDLTY
jgi:hypothetical protein